MPNDDPTVKTPASQKSRRWFTFVKYLITAVLIIVIGGGVFLYFNIYLPQGTGPAGPDVPAEPFNHIWSEQKVMLFGIGDNITDGSSVREGFSYFQRLVQNPPGDSPDMLGRNLSTVFPNLTTTNTASSWSNSIHHREAVEMMSRHPEDLMGIVVMSTGLNEILHSYGKEPPAEGAMYGASLEQALPWMDNFEKRMSEMVAQIKHLFPGGCHIFLANIYDLTDGTGNTTAWFTKAPPWPDGLSILEAYNQIIKECADKYEYVHLVDIHKPFLGHGIHCKKFWIESYTRDDPTFWYQSKSQDPSANERGHDAIRRLFLNEMIKVFYDGKITPVAKEASNGRD
ncbi:MAG: SGNH/GDSL hydrolase family protein [Sedimentisphaerales bacterium]|nr:SGNH/GDSL hydrolase family protein [Sedimentisphaerales bacterium]